MIADGLSRIAMSSGLAASLSRATDYARAHGHGEVTLEHMLLALCDDPDAVLVLAASNVNVAETTAEMGRQLAALPPSSGGDGGELVVASDMRRILEAAAAAARGGRRREINGAIVLAAIVGDGNSAAAQVLSGLGLTFEGAIRALQSKPAAAPEAPSRALPASDAESILADARERVQTRTGGRPAARGRDDAADESAASAPSAHGEHAAAAEEPEFQAEPRVKTAPPMRESHTPPQRPVNPAPALPAPPPPWSAHGSLARQLPAPDHDPEPMPEPAYEPAQAPEPPYAEYAPAGYEPAEYGPPSEFEGAEHEQHPGDDGYDPDGSAMPASPPFPPPLPAPNPHAGWAPPPSPDPNGSRLGQVPPMARAPVPMPPPPAPPGQRPGPPPLAPWPEPEHEHAPASAGFGQAQPPPPSYAPAPPMPKTAAMRGGRQPGPRAEIGQLVENVPRHMRVGVGALIEVRVARADVQALAEGLQGGGAAYQHEVMVTKAMSVRLRAPDGGFFIETASPETQWIEKAMLMSSDDFASWRWHVTPRDTRKRRLQLIISARTVSADGLAAETALPDQVITVRVRTNYGQVATRWVGWGLAAVVGGLLAKFGEGAFALLGKMITG